MTLHVNGVEHSFPNEEIPLPKMLEVLSLDDVPVVVEHNKEPLLPSQLGETMLKDGDRLEIVRVVAGG